MMKKYITDISNGIYLKEELLKEKISKNELKNTIYISTTDVITNFLGFGSAITESSGFNYNNLIDENKKKFIKDYFSKDGLNFSFGRISIGSNDFSLNSYQYAYKKDLSDFSIERDYEYVIPFLKDILKTKKISLIASPWSPPRMYKRLPILAWGIKLSKKYYGSYSDYLIKYLEEYQKIGIDIQYITMQNEPIARQRWESCVFKLSEQYEFIYNYLLPKLTETKLLLWDHNKDDLYNTSNYLYCNNSKIGGICFHYYTGHLFNEIKKIREKYPNILLINSEMCTGYSEYNELNWIRDAEYYLNDIIGDMNNGVNAYLDWNILLSKDGGPTHSKNYVKSPSIRNNSDYIKSPIYYYLYHISHFLNHKDFVICSKPYTKDLKTVALKNDKQLVIVIMNNTNKKLEYNLVYNHKYVNDSINGHTIITYVADL